MSTRQTRTIASLFALAAMLTLSACPSIPWLDPPVEGAQCRAFELLPFPITFPPGPTFTLAGLEFTKPLSPSGTAVSSLEFRDRNLDGKAELYVGESRDIPGHTPLLLNFQAPNFPSGVSQVWIELEHFASAQVRALDGTRALITTATQTAPRVRAMLHLTSSPTTRIRHVQFLAIETNVYRVCWLL